MVAAAGDVLAGVERRPALADEDVACEDGLAWGREREGGGGVSGRGRDG